MNIGRDLVTWYHAFFRYNNCYPSSKGRCQNENKCQSVFTYLRNSMGPWSFFIDLVDNRFWWGNWWAYFYWTPVSGLHHISSQQFDRVYLGVCGWFDRRGNFRVALQSNIYSLLEDRIINQLWLTNRWTWPEKIGGDT